MTIAVISDIHANLDALKVCIDELEKIKPDKIICLGDLVDYCAEPVECIDIIRRIVNECVIGNHDEAQLKYHLADSFTEYAYITSVQTRKMLKDEHRAYFKSLPYTYSENDCLFVHASPSSKDKYEYILSPVDAEDNFKLFTEQFCFIGHTHIPVIYRLLDNKVKLIKPEEINSSGRYIINAGSVGQPRDHDPRLCFVIFDTEKFKLEYVRLDYPVKQASDKILAAGLPEFLGQRLLMGI